MAEESGPDITNPPEPVHPSPPAVHRVRLNSTELASLDHEDLIKQWNMLDAYADQLEARIASQQDAAKMTNVDEILKQQENDYSIREKLLLRRLAAKEQEVQEYVSQLAELKGAQTSGSGLHCTLLDPAVNLLISRLRQELTQTRVKLEDTQNELNAWKFTPDSNTGKRLMAKCRLLYQENEELGKMISSGRLAKLEGELALQKSFSDEVKKSQSELDEFLQDLDEDVEGMQSTIYYLQQELRKTKDALSQAERELSSLRKVESPALSEEKTNGVKLNDESSNDSCGLILKINPDDEIDGEKVTEESVACAKKRIICDNDRFTQTKKIRDSSEITIHCSDDENAGLTNGNETATRD
nr:PREDICTED: pre-mRNA-splicing regulator female-lethal(2)D-like isoform X1 [Bemisia tabaci]XP_018914612.1 PREDICTED: pre-mRNA-splicing regulator female-lethal(2)D-like isoform X1 [Bemisia tabaci]